MISTGHTWILKIYKRIYNLLKGLKEIEVHLSERQHEPPTPTVSILSWQSTSSVSSQCSEPSIKACLAEFKLTRVERS